MDFCTINTPLGIAKIDGDEHGIAAVSILNDEHSITDIVPDALQDCVYQLNEYFSGDRKTFQLKLNPKGTPFQKKSGTN